MPRLPDVSNLIAWLSAAWLVAAAVLLGLAIWRDSFALHWTTIIYLVATLLASLVAFGAMGLDKYMAGGGRRIPEVFLHSVELLGGWPGSILGQRTFHHKTTKVIYQVTFYVIVLVHVLLLSWLAYSWWTKPPETPPAEPPAATTES